MLNISWERAASESRMLFLSRLDPAGLRSGKKKSFSQNNGKFSYSLITDGVTYVLSSDFFDSSFNEKFLHNIVSFSL